MKRSSGSGQQLHTHPRSVSIAKRNALRPPPTIIGFLVLTVFAFHILLRLSQYAVHVPSWQPDPSNNAGGEEQALVARHSLLPVPEAAAGLNGTLPTNLGGARGPPLLGEAAGGARKSESSSKQHLLLPGSLDDALSSRQVDAEDGQLDGLADGGGGGAYDDDEVAAGEHSRSYAATGEARGDATSSMPQAGEAWGADLVGDLDAAAAVRGKSGVRDASGSAAASTAAGEFPQEGEQDAGGVASGGALASGTNSGASGSNGEGGDSDSDGSASDGSTGGGGTQLQQQQVLDLIGDFDGSRNSSSLQLSSDAVMALLRGQGAAEAALRRRQQKKERQARKKKPPRKKKVKRRRKHAEHLPDTGAEAGGDEGGGVAV